MKESDITQPVIDKCKQISEHWRMEIDKFGWFSLDCDPSLFNLDNYTFWKEGEAIHQATHDLLNPNQVTIYTKEKWFPIPSISDCLEKLTETNEIEIAFHSKKIGVTVDVGNPLRYSEYGKNLHEALLSALLEVLKND